MILSIRLSQIDWIVLSVYFLFLFISAIYFSTKQKNTTDYFLAGRNSKWFAIGTSIFAANISSEHLIGLAGSGAASGLAVGAYELMAVFCIFVLIWVLLPHYLKSKVFTMPEFLEKRYNSKARWYLSIVSIIAYVFTKISVALFAGAIILNYVLGWDYFYAALIIVLLSGLYTVIGGLKAVIFADIFQTIILIIGTLVLTIIGLNEVGGFSELRSSLPEMHFDMLRSAKDPSYPWPGVIFGIFILGIWYWATDQYIVQKALSAKNIDHARAGGNLTALLKILPLFLFVLPGLIARALWPAEISANPDMAFPILLTRLMPSGLAGLIIAALLAALISSLSAVFNSCASLFTMDIYKKIYPHSNDKKLLIIGRISTVTVVILGLLWIPIISHLNDQVYQYMQTVQAYISPPITTVFLVGIFWKKAHGKAAFLTLIIGGILGAFRFALDIISKSTSIGHLQFLVEIPFLNYCIILFIVCVLLMISLSIMLEDKKQVDSTLTFSGRVVDTSSGNGWLYVNIGFSIFVAISVISLWAYFS